MKCKNKAEEVPRIQPPRLDLHYIIREPLTCRSVQSHRLTCLHVASRAHPHVRCKWGWVWPRAAHRLLVTLATPIPAPQQASYSPLLHFPQSSQRAPFAPSQTPLAFFSDIPPCPQSKGRKFLWSRRSRSLLRKAWSGGPSGDKGVTWECVRKADAWPVPDLLTQRLHWDKVLGGSARRLGFEKRSLCALTCTRFAHLISYCPLAHSVAVRWGLADSTRPPGSSPRLLLFHTLSHLLTWGAHLMSPHSRGFPDHCHNPVLPRSPPSMELGLF